MLRRNLPLLLIISFGALTLVGLLLLPQLADLLLGWAGLLAAAALILGVLNLFLIHFRRLFRGENLSSFFLLLGLLAVVGLALSDQQGVTGGGVDAIFATVLLPLEAALASLIAFFLLAAAFRLFRRQRNRWSLLFLVTVILVLLGTAPVPAAFGGTVDQALGWVRDYITLLFVTAGMRGILIGVALGAITISLRLLLGWERPYSS